MSREKLDAPWLEINCIYKHEVAESCVLMWWWFGSKCFVLKYPALQGKRFNHERCLLQLAI